MDETNRLTFIDDMSHDEWQENLPPNVWDFDPCHTQDKILQ